MNKDSSVSRAILIAIVPLLFFFCSCAHHPVKLNEHYVDISAETSKPELVEVKEEASEAGPINVGIQDAILMALERNHSLVMQRLEPVIQQTSVEEEGAQFHPTLSVDFSDKKERTVQPWSSSTTTTTSSSGTDSESGSTSGSAGISEKLPTGTDITLEVDTQRTWSELYSDRHQTWAGITVTQALLQGFGAGVNLAQLRQAKLDVEISQYELRGYVEALVAEVEETYWDYSLASREIEIYEKSLELAEKQLAETEERIRIGKLAEIELAAARAEVALRKQALIDARSTLAKTKLQMLRLLNPESSSIWTREIVLKNLPEAPESILEEVESHVAVALKMRPDLNEARLRAQRGELEVVKTKNGLLPKLDLFVTWGKTGYADSFRGSFKNLDSDSYDVSAGLSLELPLGNRAAWAKHTRAVQSLEQTRLSISNMEQLTQVDVRTAFLEMNRAKEQVSATAVTCQLQQEKLRAEMEKFRVGKSTNLLVLQAQRDLVQSEIDKIRAVVTYLKAIVNLYYLEGSLLQRRGLSVSGSAPALQESE